MILSDYCSPAPVIRQVNPMNETGCRVYNSIIVLQLKMLMPGTGANMKGKGRNSGIL